MGNQYKKDTRIMIALSAKMLRYCGLLELSSFDKYQASAKKLNTEAV
jgi:hypothetical protein